MSDSSPAEFKSMNFTKSEGKSSTVNIKNERFIGEGRFGKAYEADVEVQGRSRKFVIKKFKDFEGFTPKENAANSMANYKRAKEAGLKVFTTYRLGDDETSILMTNGDSNDTVCVGTTFDNMLLARGQSTIDKIEDDKFTNLSEGIFRQAVIAAQHNISFNSDAFFFLVNTKTGDIDFVLGDLDRVDNRPIPPDQTRLLYNLDKARGVIANFLGANVLRTRDYMQRIDEMYNKVKATQSFV